MILNVIKAQYIKNYLLKISFDNDETVFVDLEQTILNEKRNIFQALKNLNYFKNFSIKFNTIAWENEADFAPEFLFELGKNRIEI